MKLENTVKASIILSAGIVVASLFLGEAAKDMKSNERYVTVKGLAER